MFSRKKKPSGGKERAKSKAGIDFGLGIPGLVSQPSEDDAELEAELYALTGHKSDNFDMSLEGADEDEDIEAELARIMGKKGSKSKSSQPIPLAPAVSHSKGVLQAMTSIDMASDVDDEDVDENDPELLNELQMLTIGDTGDVGESESEAEEAEEVKEINQLELVRSRLEMYKTAEAKAKAEKESSRARRFNRGVKTLEKLLKRCEAGETVPYTEIPPEVATNLKPAVAASHVEETTPVANPNIPQAENVLPPVISDIIVDVNPEPEPIVAAPSEDVSEPELVLQPSIPEPDEIEPPPVAPPPRAAPQPPRVAPQPTVPAEDPMVVKLKDRKEELKRCALVAKKSGDMANALESMRMVKVCDKLIDSCLSGNTVRESDIPIIPGLADKKTPVEKNVDGPKTVKSNVSFVSGEIFTIPKTIQEALDQRLSYFEKALAKAEASGDRVNAKKLGSIIKIYQNAIRLHQKGSQLPYERLPTPPGCPPIPIAFKI